MVNENDGNRNLFIYACENKNTEMLQMIVDVFQTSSEQKFEFEYTTIYGLRYTIEECTGFVFACINNLPEIVQLLINKYPSIIQNRV